MPTNRRPRLGMPTDRQALVGLILISLTITTVTAPTLARDCVDYSDHLRWLADAEVEGSLQAIIIDGCVSSIEQANRLADELIQAHKDYLPGW